MARISTRKPPRPKAPKKGKDPKRLEAVAAMPCVICVEFYEVQRSRTQVHHCIHGRYGTRRAPDCMTIPLCEGHHQGDFDKTKLALHRRPDEWKDAYGLDTDWLSWVENRLNT